MHQKITTALAKATEHVTRHINQSPELLLRKELKKLRKEELIDRLVTLEIKSQKPIKIASLVYDILEDKDCVWLTWDVLASLIHTAVPDCKTTASSLRWYQSEGMNLGKDIQFRKPAKEIAALLLEDLL